MKTLSQRIAFLVSQRQSLEKWVGAYDEPTLLKWLDSELGDSRRLEDWVSGSRVMPRMPVLHVVSGNTEHAAFQSVFRALLIGSKSWVKIPSSGLPEFEAWAAGIEGIELRRDLPEQWRSPETAVIYGNMDTVEFFRNWLDPSARLIIHGPKISAAFVFEDRDGLASDLAADIMRYGQRGCLSVQAIYHQGDTESFCQNLAYELEKWPKNPTPPSLSEAGAVRNQRELVRIRMASGAKLRLWESRNSVAWTVLYDPESALLVPSPGSGFIRVHHMPEKIYPETIGSEQRYLSTAVVEPLSAASKLDLLSPPRICAAGNAQNPGIFWHPDGEMPLAGLVRWRDLG
jgi:hypothetical protein